MKTRRQKLFDIAVYLWFAFGIYWFFQAEHRIVPIIIVVTTLAWYISLRDKSHEIEG